MNDLLERYKNWCEKGNLLPRTIDAYIGDIKHFLRYYGDRDITKVSARDIRYYLTMIKGGAKTANRKLASLSSLFNFLIEDEQIANNPVSGIRRGKVRPSAPKWLKPSEVDEVRQACLNNILARTIVEMFYFTGIRLEELRTCLLTSLDMEKRELKVMGKGGVERYVPFPVSLLSTLNSYLDWRNSKEPFLFVSPNSRQLTRNQIERIFVSLSKLSGVTVRPHKLRHSFATDAINRGMRRECLKEILGHKQISTTDWYIHIEPKIKEEYDKAYP